MKILKLTTVALLVLSLGATSCKKEETIEEVAAASSSTGNPNTNTDNAFSLKLNGTAFNTSSFYVQEQFGDIMINTQHFTGTNVGIKIKSSLSVGTHNLNDSDNFGRVDLNSGQSVNNTSSFYSNGSGNITITEHNTTTKFIKGTFNFVATDTYGNNSQNVTSGSFQANY